MNQTNYVLLSKKKKELLSGNGFIGHSLKEKNKQSESSQEEEFEVSSRSEEEFEGSSQSDSSDKEEFEVSAPLCK